MATNDLLDDYMQVGNAQPTDSYEPGENTQLVDLTEFYKDTDQSKATVMVNGLEELSLGVLSKKTARLLKLKNLDKYDPYPSAFNARLGTEGLLSSIATGFRKFIEAIIKYIRMAIDWVVNLIKGIFGFRNSKRLNEKISSNINELEDEFSKTLIGLGFPSNEYSVEAFLGNLPQDQLRQGQVAALVSKFKKDEDTIQGLIDAVPLFKEIMFELKAIGDGAVRSTDKLKRVITDEHKKALELQRRGVSQGVSTQSTESNRIYKECLEVLLALNTNKITPKLSLLFDALYGIKFTNEELDRGFNEVREKLRKEVEIKTLTLSGINAGANLGQIQDLNMKYQNIKDRDIDLSTVDWKKLGNAIQLDEADKIQQIAGLYNFPPLIAMYQSVSVHIRNFTSFCHLVTNELFKVERQIETLVNWHARTSLYYISGLSGDIQQMTKIIKEAKAQGLSPYAFADNSPKINSKFIKETQLEGFYEKMADVNHDIIEMDLLNIKGKANKFTKQLGF